MGMTLLLDVILHSQDESSERAREQAKKSFKGLSTDNAESMKEYNARAKSLALNVQYYDIEGTEQKISRRVLNGLPPCVRPRRNRNVCATGMHDSKFRELLQYWNRPPFPLSVPGWGKLSSWGKPFLGPSVGLLTAGSGCPNLRATETRQGSIH